MAKIVLSMMLLWVMFFIGLTGYHVFVKQSPRTKALFWMNFHTAIAAAGAVGITVALVVLLF